MGDNANHKGFYPWIESILKEKTKFYFQEIREFYWKKKNWDSSFINYINEFDLVIIGGGNYFELWVEDSPSGTSIGIDPSLIKNIKIPMFFNALGVDAGQGVPNICKLRFRKFLDEVLSRKNFLVSVRNDGAIENIRKHIGEEYKHKILHSVDHGFFTNYESVDLYKRFGIDKNSKNIAINIASDMSEIRFKGYKEKGEMGFIIEFSSFIEELCSRDRELNIILIPHIYRDISIIYRLLENISDELRRTRIRVSGYEIGKSGAANIFGIYKSSDLSIGMRFHANVVPIGLGTKTLGLSSYPQINNLYRELSSLDKCIDVSKTGFKDELLIKSIDLINRKTKTNTEKKIVTAMRDEITPIVKDWLSNYFEINE
ncbi:polysaccharide pyruvyl transferase family protein [Prochlorococcus marinus]|nr:polysaccharide pyruvyl transferase family protein [Prochlorococcus marinus]